MMCRGTVRSPYRGPPHPCNAGTVSTCQRCGVVIVWVTRFDGAQTWRTATETVEGRQVRIDRRT